MCIGIVYGQDDEYFLRNQIESPEPKTMTADEIRIRTNDVIGRIAPEIYGHFIEHLGGCVYGGIWKGTDANIETEDGIRIDVLELLNPLSPPVLRWPGGCFADYYHWEDGVGPREERPQRLNLFWDGVETNEFGTEEFLRLCRLVDAEAFLALNLGTGTPDEAIKWVEYCNYDEETEYTKLRTENGHPEPHDVKYWAVGNESWGCGGENDPVGYARDFRQYGNYLRALEGRLPSSIELVAVGHSTSVTWGRRYQNEPFMLSGQDWNKRVLEHLSVPDYSFNGTQVSPLDDLSIHRYIQCGDDVGFTDEQYYRLLARSHNIADDIDRTERLLETILPDQDVGIFVDEWGVWHPQFDPQNGEYRQQSTVRDAIVAAGILDIFNNRADVVAMANIAMTTNVLHCLIQTDDESAWTTPTYHVFDLYKPHMNATAVRIDIDTDRRSFDQEKQELPLVSASASIDDDQLYLTSTNRDLEKTRELTIVTDLDLGGATPSGEVLFQETDPEAYSTGTDDSDEFTGESISVEHTSDGDVTVRVPPSSVLAVDIPR